MWWNKAYINRRDWILENLGSMKLSPTQTLVLLMIDFLNQQGVPITLELLAERTAVESHVVDETIHDLVRQNILAIKVSKDALEFNLDGLFRDGVRYEYVNEGIFEVFESEFGRLLSQNELMTLNTWLSKYSEADILDGLRNAVIYKKVSMQYINAILANKQKERLGSQ